MVPSAFVTLTAGQQRTLLGVARVTIRASLGGAWLAVGGCDDPLLQLPAGCFVSLHERQTHRLRGCIGRLDAQESMIAAVQYAANGSLSDPRFTQTPVTVADLPNLDIDISILSPMRQAAHAMDFDLLNEGIYLTCGERSGCFLPQVARETGWTRQQLLERLCVEKMGLSPTAWQAPQTKLFAYTTLIIGPEPF